MFSDYVDFSGFAFVYVGWNMDEDTRTMTDEYHLPVNEEIAEVVLGNPDVTYEDAEALYFSICNSDMGISHPLAQEALDVMTEKAQE